MQKILACLMFLILLSCASAEIAKAPDKNSGKEFIERETSVASVNQETSGVEIAKPEVPEFVPVRDGTSPLKTRKISIAARNTPFRDVLYTVAETANLNLVMERGVNPDLPVTMTFNDIAIENALNLIFDSADYFYEVSENILIARAVDTRIFELGQPGVVHDYSVNVGGDILSGTSSGGTGQTSVSGSVSIKSTSDKASFQFWDSMEKSLQTMLATETGGQNASFVVNRMAGTIMVTATRKDLKKVSNFIDNLKKAFNRQVLVEARIVEVQLSEGLKYGIDWTAISDWIDGESGTISIGPKTFSAVVGSNSPNFEINVLDNNDFSLLLKALQQQGDVKTLSNPRVSILNGHTTMLSVGRNTTFISRVETTTTTAEGSAPITTFTVDTNSILSGIMFGLVPYIDSNREITLTITPIVTNLVELEAKTIGTGDNTVEIKLPTVDLREMSTMVKVLDGQMIIIGGLIDKKEKYKEDKIPILGDIPVIGGAFKRVDKTYESTELVIMLIPRVVS